MWMISINNNIRDDLCSNISSRLAVWFGLYMLPPGNTLGIDLQSCSMQIIDSCSSVWHGRISPIDKLVQRMDHISGWDRRCPQREASTQASVWSSWILIWIWYSFLCQADAEKTPSSLAALITVILSCLILPGKPWNADALKRSSRCAGQVQRQRPHYICLEVLSPRSDFKIMLLVFESVSLLV